MTPETMTQDFQSRLNSIFEEFEIFDDWEERYKYIIDLGKDLPPLSLSEKIDKNKVLGCASQVWLVIDSQKNGNSPESADVVHFRGDSDAFIVKGLIALLVRLLDGASKEDIQNFSIHNTLETLGLKETLSSQRTNGLMSIVARLKRA